MQPESALVLVPLQLLRPSFQSYNSLTPSLDSEKNSGGSSAATFTQRFMQYNSSSVNYSFTNITASCGFLLIQYSSQQIVLTLAKPLHTFWVCVIFAKLPAWVQEFDWDATDCIFISICFGWYDFHIFCCEKNGHRHFLRSNNKRKTQQQNTTLKPKFLFLLTNKNMWSIVVLQKNCEKYHGVRDTISSVEDQKQYHGKQTNRRTYLCGKCMDIRSDLIGKKISTPSVVHVLGFQFLKHCN